MILRSITSYSDHHHFQQTTALKLLFLKKSNIIIVSVRYEGIQIITEYVTKLIENLFHFLIHHSIINQMLRLQGVLVE